MVAPDLFNGTPAPSDINSPSLDINAFLAAHGPSVSDPIVATAIKYLRSVGVKRIGSTGYCFGGRYAFRAAAPGVGANVAFAAHPSLLDDGEITAAAGPAGIAAAGESSCSSHISCHVSSPHVGSAWS